MSIFYLVYFISSIVLICVCTFVQIRMHECMDRKRNMNVDSPFLPREWNVERLLPVAHRVLPHPSFVYSARYHPAAAHLVVTGGYDGPLRAWRLDVQDVNGELLREFEGHDGGGAFVNAVCFDREGTLAGNLTALARGSWQGT